MKYISVGAPIGAGISRIMAMAVRVATQQPQVKRVIYVGRPELYDQLVRRLRELVGVDYSKVMRMPAQRVAVQPGDVLVSQMQSGMLVAMLHQARMTDCYVMLFNDVIGGPSMWASGPPKRQQGQGGTTPQAHMRKGQGA